MAAIKVDLPALGYPTRPTSARSFSSSWSQCSSPGVPGSQRVGTRLVGVAKRDRKSTRLNSSHDQISYAVFCLKKKKKTDYKLHVRMSLEIVIPIMVGIDFSLKSEN